LATLQRKRKEYAHLVNQAFGRGMTTMDAQVSGLALIVMLIN
jgi:hypothetical protein